MNTEQREAPLFQGRIGVVQFWKASLFLWLVPIFICLAAFFILPSFLYLILLIPVAFLVTLPIFFGLEIRRAHDIGMSGWKLISLQIAAALLTYFFPTSTIVVDAEDILATSKVISPFGIAISSAVIIGFVILLSWPGKRDINAYGEPKNYSSVLGAIFGKEDLRITKGILALFILVLGVILFYAARSPIVHSFLPANLPSDLGSANEIVEVVGPTPEVKRDEWKDQAGYGNTPYNINFNKSGTTVGYSVGITPIQKPYSYYYYVKDGVTHGPFAPNFPDLPPGQVMRTVEEIDAIFNATPGWEIGLSFKDWTIATSSDSKGGHTIQVVGTGPQLDMFDSQAPSRDRVLYDGRELGLYKRGTGDTSLEHRPVPWVLLSDDGLHYAYVVHPKYEHYYLVVDGLKSNDYLTIENLHFENDAFVFNTVSKDYSQFLRVKIPIAR